MKSIVPDSLPIPTQKQAISDLVKGIKAYCKKAMMTQKEIKELLASIEQAPGLVNGDRIAAVWMPGKAFKDDRPRFAGAINALAEEYYKKEKAALRKMAISHFTK